MVAALQTLGTEEITRRAEQARRMIRENGTTYNAYSDGQETVRPWNLDVTPLLVPAGEWKRIAEGLVQRTRLINAVLADLYGSQRLLQRGLLPAELVFSHPAFLRQFHGLRLPGDSFLHVYAADLARSTEGNWCVTADRTDAPQGTGYTLENRIVVSRLLPGVMHECRVERLASFFIALQEALRSLAPQHRENPRIVLLSQGPASASYFEDAYLARYLGYTLVEVGDLTVRGERVVLKTLGGLLPVDVVLRRLSDLHMDPLELRGPAELGVPGLLQAMRAGNVAVANGLGSSLLESPAFLPFLPQLCREMLSEDLLLASVPTWWCGQPAECQFVLEHLDQLVVRAAFRCGRLPHLAGEQLEHLNFQQLADAIRAAPHLYVAQQRLDRSTSPVFSPEGWKPARVALRSFVVAGGGKITVMPGGLLRLSESSDPLDWSILSGEGSKDTWVLADGPVQEISLLQPPGKHVELRRSGTELPSRVADNLFWLGRYVERADACTRLLRTTAARLASETGARDRPELAVLLRCLAAQGQIEPGFVVEGIREQLPEIEQMLPAAALDTRQTTNLRSILATVHRLASLVRDRLSIDTWRILHGVERDMQPLLAQQRVDLADLLTFLNRVVIDLAAFSGLVAESTTRTQGWRFLEMGRRLERALHTIELIRNSLVSSSDTEPSVLEAILEVADSIMTYRSRYLAHLQLAPALDLLLTDETNPRSLAFQLAALAEHVENLPRDHTQALRGPEQRIAISALSAIRLIDVELLSECQRSGERTKMDRLLERLGEQLPKLADLVSHKYLVHAASPRQLAGRRPGGSP
jgi:uncharacterized circularly permuted ATP-grasp superfamily protein/uncharacterized alpha-E superfamily protein